MGNSQVKENKETKFINDSGTINIDMGSDNNHMQHVEFMASQQQMADNIKREQFENESIEDVDELPSRRMGDGDAKYATIESINIDEENVDQELMSAIMNRGTSKTEVGNNDASKVPLMNSDMPKRSGGNDIIALAKQMEQSRGGGE